MGCDNDSIIMKIDWWPLILFSPFVLMLLGILAGGIKISCI